MDKNIIILGIGSEILTDDGIGPRLVRDLRAIGSYPTAHYQVAGVGGIDILDYIEGYNTAIFLDAAKTGQGVPGSIHHFTPRDFKETAHLSNIHDVNFLTALDLGNKLDIKVPKIIHIFAVEIVEDGEFSESLSAPLQAIYPQILAEVRERIGAIVNRY